LLFLDPILFLLLNRVVFIRHRTSLPHLFMGTGFLAFAILLHIVWHMAGRVLPLPHSFLHLLALLLAASIVFLTPSSALSSSRAGSAGTTATSSARLHR
jgi:phosphoglycerol transferase MdoB-like AlkP superfamily enzyme